jgi:hypothetical protein
VILIGRWWGRFRFGSVRIKDFLFWVLTFTGKYVICIIWRGSLSGNSIILYNTHNILPRPFVVFLCNIALICLIFALFRVFRVVVGHILLENADGYYYIIIDEGGAE